MARVLSVMLAVVVVVLTAAGLKSAVSGPGPAMLVVPGFLTAFYLFAWAATAWQVQNAVELLIRELSEILGAANSP
jgi:uncharacterized membrane protein YadS